MAVCTKCGTQLGEGVQFCPSCGQAAAAPPPQAPPPQAAPPQAYQQPPQAPPAPGYPPPPAPGYQQPPQAPPAPGYPPPPAPGYQQPGYPPQPGYGPPQSDAEANKVMAVLSYLWLLFLIPLCMGKHKESPFAKFHLNQGIILAIFTTGYSIVSGILQAIIQTEVYWWGVPTGVYTTPGWLVAILGLLGIPFGILCIIGIINSVKGEFKPLPVIGNMFTILK